MSNKPDLAEAIEQIIAKVEEKIQAARANTLSEIKTMITGDATNKNKIPPMLWLITDTARVSPESTTLREIWSLPIMLVVVVKDSADPEKGQKLATKLAARARSVVLKIKSGEKYVKDRDLGLSFVNHVESTAFEPRTRFPSEGGKYSAGTAINIEFTIFE